MDVKHEGFSMANRFSSKELFELRNRIPVKTLIRDTLNMSVKNSDGHFRFLCPICHEFRTGVNVSTNLARCFRCEKNFNPIDMVMVAQGSGFVESAKFLKSLLGSVRFGHRESALKEMLGRIGTRR